jgi:DNA-binding transcriptional LysR family regulator
MMDVSWDDWRVVHAAWTTGSFTAAAEVLGIGQATVSRRVAQVEEALGQVLFDRHRTGLVPTSAARAVWPHLEAMTAAAHGAARAVEGLETEAAGVVRIAGPPGLCVDWITEVARRVARDHPRLRLDVLADIQARDLDRREADIAVRAMPTDRGDLLVRRLTTVAGGLYAAPSLVASLSPEATLAEVPMVAWSAELAHIPLARYLASLSDRPPALTTNDYLVLRAAVIAGIGASVLSTDEARRFGLVPVPIAGARSEPMPRMDLFLVVHRALRHVPRVAVVIRTLDAMVAELTP